MSRKPPPPYCLSRQHPELAVRSQAKRGPLASRQDIPAPPPPPVQDPPRKGL